MTRRGLRANESTAHSLTLVSLLSARVAARCKGFLMRLQIFGHPFGSTSTAFQPKPQSTANYQMPATADAGIRCMIARQCLAMLWFAVADIATLLVVDCPLSHKGPPGCCVHHSDFRSQVPSLSACVCPGKDQ